MRDLADIAREIGADNPSAAVRMVLTIRDRASILAVYPMRGRSRLEIRVGLRSITVAPYLILHRIEPSGNVTVLRVVHGARDLSALRVDVRETGAPPLNISD